MGCIFSVFTFIIKIITTVIKLVVKAVAYTIKFLIRIGLLLPLVYAAVGLGLWLAQSEIMLAGTTGFWIYHIGFGLLTVFSIGRSIKKAMDAHNAKYDENGRKIKND